MEFTMLMANVQAQPCAFPSSKAKLAHILYDDLIREIKVSALKGPGADSVTRSGPLLAPCLFTLVANSSCDP